MPTTERYEIAPITLPYGVTPTDLHLQQMQSFQVSPSVQKSRIRAGGSVDALAFMAGRAKPQITFATRDLATVLAEISPLSGLCITGLAKFRELERDACSIWTGGGVEFTAEGGGFVYPMSMGGSSEDVEGISLSSTFLPYWNGTDPPITAAYVADMSGAPVAAFLSQFFCGPVYAGASEILGITQTNIDFGLTVSGSPRSPGPYDRVSAISDRQPVFTYTTTKSDANLNLFGECSPLTFYYQRGAACSDREPYANAVHIAVTCTSGFVEVSDTGGEAASDANVSVSVSPIGPIAISISSTIPTGGLLREETE